MDIIKNLLLLKNNLEKELIKEKINFNKSSDLFKNNFMFINEEYFELIKTIKKLIKFKKIYFGKINSRPLSDEEIKELKNTIKKSSIILEKILYEYFLLK